MLRNYSLNSLKKKKNLKIFVTFSFSPLLAACLGCFLHWSWAKNDFII